MKNLYKLGFACKILTDDPKVDALYNFKTTTVKFLTEKSKIEREKIVQELCLSNVIKLKKQLEFVSTMPKHLQMFRIGSDLLPIFTHEITKDIYTEKFINNLSDMLKKIGEFARKKEIRLSFHPGQFTVLGSLNEGVVQKSIEELEYHALIFSLMGYSGWHPNGLAINIHGGSKQAGLEILRRNINRCSLDVKNFLTIENDEFSYNAEELEPIFEVVPVVLDVHHQWIATGEYLQSSSDVFRKIIDSWRGIKPKIHYSISKEEYIKNDCLDSLPNLKLLLENGHKKTVLREHSNNYWNTSVNQYVKTFLPYADIMCEAKDKNKSSEELLRNIN